MVLSKEKRFQTFLGMPKNFALTFTVFFVNRYFVFWCCVTSFVQCKGLDKFCFKTVCLLVTVWPVFSCLSCVSISNRTNKQNLKHLLSFFSKLI